jgi:hypothetical protein
MISLYRARRIRNIDMEGIQVGTDCLDGPEVLGRCGTDLEDIVFGCFGWAGDAVGRLRSHGSVGGLQNDSEGVWDLAE